MNRAVRIHLGFRIYLTYDYYEGDSLFSIRQYYLIEGKEVAGKKGVSVRCGNFSKLIRTIQGQLAIGVKIKLRNLFLVENSIELVLQKRALARAKGNCNACCQGFRVTHPEHQVRCLLDWAHIVQEQLILPEHLPDLAAEAALATLAFDDTKGALAHAFGYLYSKYFTNDAGTTTGPPQPAAEEEVEQPPAALPPALPDRLLGQGQPQGPSGLREAAGAQGVLAALPPAQVLGSPDSPPDRTWQPDCPSGRMGSPHPPNPQNMRQRGPLQGGHPPNEASVDLST